MTDDAADAEERPADAGEAFTDATDADDTAEAARTNVDSGVETDGPDGVDSVEGADSDATSSPTDAEAAASDADADQAHENEVNADDAGENEADEVGQDEVGQEEVGQDDGDEDGSDRIDADEDEAKSEAGDPTEPSLADGLAARVANYDEELAAEVAEIEADAASAEAELAERESEVEDLTDRLKRKQADFQNYKKRAKKRQEQLKERATQDFVERIVDVRDNLLRALDQDEDVDIRPGVESTLEEFDRVLEEENVQPIEPDPGDEVDPTRHQVMMRVESDQPEGTVADVYQPGYEMADAVVREAQITVSDGE